MKKKIVSKSFVIVLSILATCVLACLLYYYITDKIHGMDKEFDIQYESFRTTYLEITGCMENNYNDEECLREILSDEHLDGNMLKLKNNVEYMNKNADSTNELSVSESFLRELLILEEYVYKDPEFLEAEIGSYQSQKLDDDYSFIKIYRRQLKEGLT